MGNGGSITAIFNPFLGAAGGLWRNGDFLKLWTGQTISLLGTQVSGVALPLTAILVLGAGPVEVGILGAARWLPYLLVGLVAGAWIDRVPRRPVLIGADVARAALLGSIPLAAPAGGLRIEQLYGVVFAVGVLSIFFDAAYQAHLPSLVRREELIEGNSKLETSRALAQISGSGGAGVLVQWLTAPLAIALDAGSYLASALAIRLIRAPEPPLPPPATPHHLGREIAEGLRWVYGHPWLRAISTTTIVRFLFSSMGNAILVLYMTQDLHFDPVTVGLVYAVGGPGALAGSFVTERITRRLGVGPTMIAMRALFAGSTLLFPLAALVPPLAAPLLGLAQFIIGLDIAVEGINDLSLRQSITPARLQGRMNATMRSLNWGTVAIGSLLGGALGAAWGLQPTLVFSSLGLGLSALLLGLSPLRSVRAAPASNEG